MIALPPLPPGPPLGGAGAPAELVAFAPACPVPAEEPPPPPYAAVFPMTPAPPLKYPPRTGTVPPRPPAPLADTVAPVPGYPPFAEMVTASPGKTDDAPTPPTPELTPTVPPIPPAPTVTT